MTLRGKLLVGLIAMAAVVACGGPPAPPGGPPASGARPPARAAAGGGEGHFGLPLTVPRRRFMPDLTGVSAAGELRSREGVLRLAGRMRLVVRPDGGVERADELLPMGNRPFAVRLPERLGGGFVFLVNSPRGTDLWRSSSWLGELVPLASFSSTPDSEEPLVVGFDRLYVRLRSNNEIVSIDPKDGTIVSRGSLPVAPAYGDMVFLDAWRAVVDTDMGGTLATFDAGATWSRLPIRGVSTLPVPAQRTSSLGSTRSDPDDGGEAVIVVEGGYYLLAASGDLTFQPGAPPVFSASGAPVDGEGDAAIASLEEALLASRALGPLGKRPLRIALELGYPDSDTTAVVVHQGVLGRVSLYDGRVLGAAMNAFPDGHLTCHGIALGGAERAEDRFGFVCGGAGAGTVVYAFEPPLGLRQVFRFSTPRVVTESGQGAIVVSGSCSDEADSEPGVRPFCVRFADGATREIRVRGDVGAERVVALADGRIAILVPPRPGAQGQISVLEGVSSKHLPLILPDATAPRELETGLWLQGFQEVAPGELGGFIEAGGPMLGVRVKLDGTVTVGEVVDEPQGVVVAGRFGLAVGDRGRMLETTDAGKTWTELLVPTLELAGDTSRTRRCGPAGCAVGGWLKIGWGEPASGRDLEEARPPVAAKLTSMRLTGRPLSFACGDARAAAEPAASNKKNAGEASTGWLHFRGKDPPAMEKGEVGIDNGAPFDAVAVRAYAWGKRDADWSRTGKLVVRFADKYALDEVRSSAPTASPWANETLASEALGVGPQGYSISWSATRDPGRPAALVSACRAGASCTLMGVENGEPVLPLRGGGLPTMPVPIAGSAVRLGQSWVFLGNIGARDRVGLFRADLGSVRLLRVLDRPPAGRFTVGTMPKLVRRANTEGLGLLFVVKDGVLDRRGTRFVIPLDPETGEAGDPIRLGRPDFGDIAVSASCDGRDGWLVELGGLEPTPDLKVDGAPTTLEGAELKVRLDPGYACLERASGVLAQRGKPREASGAGPKSRPSGPTFPLLATDRGEGSRTELTCRLVEPSIVDGLFPGSPGPSVSLPTEVPASVPPKPARPKLPKATPAPPSKPRPGPRPKPRR